MVTVSKIVDNSTTNDAIGIQNKNETLAANNNQAAAPNVSSSKAVNAPTAKKTTAASKYSTSAMTTTNNNTTSSSTVALTASGKPKEKRRNNEKRKERSRDAARCRRSRETEIFSELGQVLPLKNEDVQQLDKASVMRIAISYLKVRDMLKMFPKIEELRGDPQIVEDKSIENKETDTENSAGNSAIDCHDTSTQSSQLTDDSTQQTIVETEESSSNSATNNESVGLGDLGLLLKQTLDGFLLILSNDGDITYVTGNISEYLGLSKIDVLGQQIWEYAHQCDHAELKEALNIKRNGLTDKVKDEQFVEEGISTHHRDLFVRLKCTITSRGRSINIKSASYKVIHITGHLVVNKKGDRVLVAMGRPLPHPSNIEVPLGTSTFLTKHSLDLKFTYADDKMFNLLGYKPEDLLETSLFNYHHGVDSESLMTTFKNVLSKGQGETCRYRFLGKYGGYCWLITQATIVYEKLKPQSVVCINFVISNLEKNNEIYTLQQYEAKQKLKLNDKSESVNENKPKEDIDKHQLQLQEDKSDAPTLESLEPIAAKVENSTRSPTPLNNNHTNHQNQKQDLNNKIIDNKSNTTPLIKQEQITTITLNNNNNKTVESKHSAEQAVADSANSSLLLPTTLIQPPQQLPTAAVHCPTTTVTHTVFNKSKTTSKFVTDDKRPRIVTSSLILTNLPTTTSTQSILLQQPFNATPRAPQSVTASVFSPLPPLKLPSTTATAAILAQQPEQQSQNPSQQEQSAGGQQQADHATHQQDMNKGYLSFAEDAAELTMLKEEPDDLAAHLVATNAVDACMPLDESGPLFGEILVGFGMGSYGSLLPDDINSLDSNTSSDEQNNNNQTTLKQASGNTNTCAPTSVPSSKTSSTATLYDATTMTATSSHNLRQSSPSLITTTTCATNNNNNNTITAATTTNCTNIDPFINYRDESNDTNCSQHLLSPSVTSKSPEGSSLPSLCSPNSLSQEDEFSYYTMNVDDMDDLTMRAPYIPMNEQDDLPLLTSDDYMWSSGNAFTPDEFSLHTKDSDNLQAFQINQSLSYQQQQFTQQQMQQFSNSLCSSPASTVSSMSPSPIQQQQQQQYNSDSSELASLLCGNANNSITILHSANFTNSLNLNVGDNGTGNNNNNNSGNNENGGMGLTDDLDSVSVGSPTAALDHHQELQQHCLQQLQEQLEQQHHHQRQQLLSGLNINCKKEKFECAANNSPSLTANLCDTIEDTFDNVYSKNSTNLDCWNEFLQIGTNENTNTTNNAATASTQQQQQVMESLRQEDCKQQLQMQLQQTQQQQQNIIINAVPLITIQTTSNNKNVLIPTMNNHQQHLATQNSQSNTKSLNKVNAIKLTPIANTATIKIIENKQNQQQQQALMQQRPQPNIGKTAIMQTTPTLATSLPNNNNKRHSSNVQILSNTMETKRLKSNIMDIQNSSTTSQLLQQLITTPQHQGNLNTKNSKGLLETRWVVANENQTLAQLQQQKQLQKQQKQSNSVLKNLLISGCDNANLADTEIGLIDDNSRSSMQSPDGCCLSNSVTRPLQCVTSSTALLRNYRHNPWIGGPVAQASPTCNLITNDDSNPPGLTPCDAVDSASDSGIDDISVTENMSPLKRPFEQQKNQITNVFGIQATPIKTKSGTNSEYDNNLKSNEMNEGEVIQVNSAKPQVQAMLDVELVGGLNEDDDDEEIGASVSKRKRSLSYLDSSNPLMTPFLMDLCNDDYHMNSKEYLQENDIENVLSEWPVDLV